MSESNTRSPSVAFVIPVYNAGERLRQCLDSIRTQSFSGWEAWVVDDGSCDDSRSVIEEFVSADSRFHALYNGCNKSAWVCRARGVSSVSETVSYVMFADADDTLEPFAAEYAVGIMENEQADILHFGTNVRNCGGVSQQRIKDYRRYLEPHIGRLDGPAVFSDFISRDFEGHLWNKMFRIAPLRRAISAVGEDAYLPKAQDKVLYWALCAFNENISYYGVQRRLYNYNYGLGVEGRTDHITIDQCRQYMSLAYSEDMLERISEMAGVSDRIAGILTSSRQNSIRHCVRNLLRLPQSLLPEGVAMLPEYWKKSGDGVMAACALAEFGYDGRYCLAESVSRSEAFGVPSRRVRTIGTYYECMRNGGIQRVLSGLFRVWHALGYDIILFTDEQPSPDDYPVGEYVKRVVLPVSAAECNARSYTERGMALGKLMKEYGVDCMVYHAYFAEILLFDELVCRAEGIPFVLFQHNVFSRYLRYADGRFSYISWCSTMADAIVCLSDTDSRWWKLLNGNVHLVLDPPTFDYASARPAPREGHTVLFLSRLEENAKRPSHAVEIIARAVRTIPDIKLKIVGDTSDTAYVERLRRRIRELGIGNNVDFCGFYSDVSRFYLESSVFLSCSSHEGFMLTLCEAMAHALPVVMYELPYLTVADGNSGILTAAQEDTDTAAELLCKLLADREELVRVGNNGREFLLKLYEKDMPDQWAGIFASVENKPCELQEKYTRMMAYTLIRDAQAGVSAAAPAKSSILKKAVRYYRQNGIRQTIRRVKEKMQGG